MQRFMVKIISDIKLPGEVGSQTLATNLDERLSNEPIRHRGAGVEPELQTQLSLGTREGSIHMKLPDDSRKWPGAQDCCLFC